MPNDNIEKAIAHKPNAERVPDVKAVKAERDKRLQEIRSSTRNSLDDLKAKMNDNTSIAEELSIIGEQKLTQEELMQKIDAYLADKSLSELRKIARNKDTPAGKRAQELIDTLEQ